MLHKVSYVGAGSMAEAMISGMVENVILQPNQIYVTNRANQERLNYLESKYQIKGSTDKSYVIENADVIFLAMKPKDIDTAIDTLKPHLNESQLIISVLAGVSTDYISKQLNSKNPVVRAMPNTSAMVGKSATTIAAGKYATDSELKIAISLLEAIGMATVVKESELDITTAIAGSGPAYFYYMVEAMEKAAVEKGLDKHTAKQLIHQTILGAAEMLIETGDEPATLIDNITSPGGTTEVGIKTLASYDFQEIVAKCVNSAAQRSNELGKEFK